jgi:hypothetical protein
VLLRCVCTHALKLCAADVDKLPEVAVTLLLLLSLQLLLQSGYHCCRSSSNTDTAVTALSTVDHIHCTAAAVTMTVLALLHYQRYTMLTR